MSVLSFEPSLINIPKIKNPNLNEARFPQNVINGQPFVDTTWNRVPIPKGIEHVANLDINSLVTSEDITKLQTDANEYAKKRYEDSTWKKMTIRNAVKDAYEALVGIPEDIYQNSGRISLKKLLVKNNRLRGLGVLLVVLSVVTMLFMTI